MFEHVIELSALKTALKIRFLISDARNYIKQFDYILNKNTLWKNVNFSNAQHSFILNFTNKYGINSIDF